VVEHRNVQSSDLVEGPEKNVTDFHVCAFSSTLITLPYEPFFQNSVLRMFLGRVHWLKRSRI
jgi:hypothetical protein